ncbi:hypothetical protein NM208_g9772 [Fusarium decemcellulare]|uniref:Uncharacterized protein n=1 Tax=Fusarium decemcellulare TaxID=57161 RepID=A0ACC1S0D1_9HYPO|nr:hypothetical protein NM208_g9772 [Fusarium decemcellulare]
MWLMENEKLSKRKAYDITRREFYRLRQEEEIEKRVALEEAKHVGAYFGKTRIDVGHILEDKEFENWKIWAGKETERQEAMRSSEIESFAWRRREPPRDSGCGCGGHRSKGGLELRLEGG